MPQSNARWKYSWQCSGAGSVFLGFCCFLLEWLFAVLVSVAVAISVSVAVAVAVALVADFGSVEVTKYQMIHKYSKIMHICSQVEGNIRKDRDALDAIQSVLPAGTLSGAPKIRACEIIDELEPEPRGIYGGALGYIDFSGNLDTCIAIRMAVKKKNKVYVQAGGGIVADSKPDMEYEESANKAKAVMLAIENAKEALEP